MHIFDRLRELPYNESSEAWHSSYMFSDNYYPVLQQLALDYRAVDILEVGVRLGYSATSFVDGNPYVRTYTGLDNESYLPGSNAKALQNIRHVRPDLPVSVSKLDTMSDDPSRLLIDRRFDFVHIDGDHTEAGAYRDIMRFWPYVLPGGRMLVDDSSNIADVRNAIKRAVAELKTPNYDVASLRGTWIIYKPQSSVSADRTTGTSLSVIPITSRSLKINS